MLQFHHFTNYLVIIPVLCKLVHTSFTSKVMQELVETFKMVGISINNKRPAEAVCSSILIEYELSHVLMAEQCSPDCFVMRCLWAYLGDVHASKLLRKICLMSGTMTMVYNKGDCKRIAL